LRDTAEVVEVVERIDVEEGVLRMTGVSLVVSVGEEDAVGRLPLTAGDDFVVAVDDGRDRTTLGVDVPVVLTLTVECVDAADRRRDRGAELGGISDFAVAKVVEPPSLVEDSVDDGLLFVDTGRRVDGPAAVLRNVDARDCVDLTEGARDRGLGLSPVDKVFDSVRRVAVETCVVLVRVDSATDAREDEVGTLGVNLESGRGLVGTLSVGVRDIVVLVAVDFTDAADDFTPSACFVVCRLITLVRRECMLPVSFSSALSRVDRTPSRVGVPGLGGGTVAGGPNRSSMGTSTS